MIEVKLINYTRNPEMVVASAARTCIRDKSFGEICEELTKQDIERVIKKVISKNHLSVLEHVNFSFSISGVSRIFTHQLVRHRMASYSQLSQQRTDSSRLEFTIPPEIENDAELAESYKEVLLQCQKFYKHLIKCGISRGAARYVLPASFGTRILITLNARSLFNLLAQRECEIEDWEFKLVAKYIHTELLKVSPLIFQFAGPSCWTHNFCPEGKRLYECPGYLKSKSTQITNEPYLLER